MLSPRPLASSALALLGLAATLGLARPARATPPLIISTQTIIGTDQLLDQLTVTSTGVLGVKPLRGGGTGILRIRARKITVEEKGIITATKAGYLGVNGADGNAAPGSGGGGKYPTTLGHPGGGGGYLGAGASGASDLCEALLDAAGGAAFAMPSEATPILGSAGGAANINNMATAGGDGGGVIILEAAEIVINGTVEARGESPMASAGVARGGGSGGLIVINTAHLSGTGVITVAGGDGFAAPGVGAIPANNGGGGAGGVILLKARDVAQTIQDQLEVRGGKTGSCPATLDGKEGLKTVDLLDPTFCVDVDRDSAFAITCGGTDCDDSDAAIKPGLKEVCNAVDDNCDGVNNEGDDLCSAGRTCDPTAKMCIDISDAGSDGGPTIDPGAPPDHIIFESGCSFRCGNDGPGALALVALGLGALMTRRRRASHHEKACR